MSKYSVIIILSILIICSPLLGIHQSIKDWAIVFAGALIILVTLSIRKSDVVSRSGNDRPKENSVYAENNLKNMQKKEDVRSDLLS